MLNIKRFTIFMLLALNVSFSTPAISQPLDLSVYGSFVHSPTANKSLFLFGEIQKDDSFHLRKALRNHEISNIVLLSPGGAVFEGLQLAGIIHDKGLGTIVPSRGLDGIGRCASACSFMFFAGKKRKISGQLGVHQFYSADKNRSAEIGAVQEGVQITASQIIGFLNEFQTPPFVFEKMFQQTDMYYFNSDEVSQLETKETTFPNEIIENIDDFIERFRIEIDQYLKSEHSEQQSSEVTPRTDVPAPQPRKKLIIEDETKPDDDIFKLQKNTAKLVQSNLNRIGCDLGRVDGVVGPASKRALRLYNSVNGSFHSPTQFFYSSQTLEELRKKPSGFCPAPARKKPVSLKNKYELAVSCGGSTKKHWLYFYAPSTTGHYVEKIPSTVSHSFTLENRGRGEYGLCGGLTCLWRFSGWLHHTSQPRTFKIRVNKYSTEYQPEPAGFNGTYKFSADGRIFEGKDANGCSVTGRAQ